MNGRGRALIKLYFCKSAAVGPLNTLLGSCDSSQRPLSPSNCPQMPRHRDRWTGLPFLRISAVITVIGTFRARSLGTYRVIGATFDPGDTVGSRRAMASRAQFGERLRQQSNDHCKVRTVPRAMLGPGLGAAGEFLRKGGLSKDLKEQLALTRGE